MSNSLTYQVTDEAVESIENGSIVIEIQTTRYGIRTDVDNSLVVFTSVEGSKELREELEAEAVNEAGDAAEAALNGQDWDEDGEPKIKERRVKVAQVDKSLVTVRKKIFKSPEWQAIKNFDQQTYRHIQTLANKSNLRRGCYRIPNQHWAPLKEYLNARMGEREALVEAFVGAYEGLKAQAKRDLNTLYNEADYDTEARVRRSFSFAYAVMPSEGVPVHLAALDMDAYKLETRKAKERVAREAEAMAIELRQGFAALVANAVEKLQPEEEGEKPKQFRQSTLDKFSQWFDLFEGRNLAGDTSLADMVAKSRQLLNGVTDKTLKEDSKAKDRIRRGFESINKNMDKMVKAGAGRRVRELRD